MNLEQLLKPVGKKFQKIKIKRISFDSRKIKKGDIFFAIKGNKTSGTKFIDNVILKGASAIVIERKEKNKNYKIPTIIVKNVRESLSEACSNFYREKPNNIIAVTGTNGKSSVVNFFYQILNFNNIPVASIGTLGIFSKKYNKKINLTSMDPLSLHKNLQILAENKSDNLILEASSHGLKQMRLNNLNINTGIFTNFSQDHLDYHKNMKNYFDSKMYLFKNLLKKKSNVITDEDNKEFDTLKKISELKKLKRITIGSKSGSIKILSNKYNKQRQIIKISINKKIISLEIPLIGYFQIKNLLMAVLAASTCGLNKNKVLKQLYKIKPVSGRLECIVSLKNNSNIIIDFAHTPDALKQSLIALKEQFKKEIILVFGCGGERDKTKRSTMGKIASKYCKKIFITDDNPRNENPKKIRISIMKGCNGRKNVFEIGNRTKAIEKAIKELESNQILLVAGKGHETNQDYGKKIIKFSDKKVIKQIIKKKFLVFKKENYQKKLLKETFGKTFDKDIKFDGVSIDTKTIKKNNLFFAIKGKNTDGHNFVNDAIKKRASGLVVSKNIKKTSKKNIIKVKNTFSSLNDLARVTRSNSLARIIGITGSVGKTTLKNLISFSLKKFGKVYYSPLSYNNKFGVPLSVSNLKKNTNFGVFEIGMDKKGEIERLSKIVKPEIGIITNISEAHFKNFRTLKDIAKAKSEIIHNIPQHGNIILNKDSKFFSSLSKKAKERGINVTSFSSKKKSDIFLVSVEKLKRNFRIKINVKNKIFYFETKYSTQSFTNNILACVSTLSVLNLNLIKLKKEFLKFKIPEGRGDINIIKKYNKKFKFIDESYNANPLSMRSAIDNINHYKKKCCQKIVFLGDMLELGKHSKRFHKELSNIINKSSIDKVFVHGKYIKETFNGLTVSKKGKMFHSMEEAYNHFSKILNNNDLLMVKGSNATGLNKFSKNIKKGQISAI